jgi:hypothetical protein
VSATPAIKVYGSGYGYQFDSGYQLSVDDYLVPTKDGALPPFSVLARLVLLKGAHGTIFRTASQTDDFSLTLAVNRARELVLELGKNKTMVTVPSTINLDEQVHELCLNVVPLDAGLFCQWFLDDLEISSSTVAFANMGIAAAGHITIGGEGAAAVVLDEFGLYAKANGQTRSSWSSCFESAMRKLYKDDLVFAFGFDGQDIPAGLEAKGTARLGSGAFNLERNSSLRLPSLARMHGNVTLSMPFSLQPERDLSAAAFVFRSDGKELARIDLAGKVSVAGGDSQAFFPVGRGQMQIQLNPTDGYCYAAAEGKRLRLFAYTASSFPDLLIETGEARLSVASIVCRYVNVTNSTASASASDKVAVKNMPPVAQGGAGI